MPNKAALVQVTVTAAPGWAALGTAVPANMRRSIYSLHTQTAVALNTLSIRLAAAGVAIDTLYHALAGDEQRQPSVLLDNSEPLYVVEAAAQAQVQTDVGNCLVRVQYEDEYI
ncbi:MAG: hypothetical protein V2A77_00565 [Pseudomonadota bacterium]